MIFCILNNFPCVVLRKKWVGAVENNIVYEIVYKNEKIWLNTGVQFSRKKIAYNSSIIDIVSDEIMKESGWKEVFD